MKSNNDLADMAMFIVETFPTYMTGDDNPIDTAMKIMTGLQAKVEALKAENKELEEKAWMYDDLCK